MDSSSTQYLNSSDELNSTAKLTLEQFYYFEFVKTKSVLHYNVTARVNVPKQFGS